MSKIGKFICALGFVTAVSMPIVIAPSAYAKGVNKAINKAINNASSEEDRQRIRDANVVSIDGTIYRRESPLGQWKKCPECDKLANQTDSNRPGVVIQNGKVIKSTAGSATHE